MLYSIENLVKTRKRENGYRLLVKNLSLAKGAKIALTGPSGCGKSTLLDILGLSLAADFADKFEFSPDASVVKIAPLWKDRRFDELASLRLDNIGYVLQTGELLACLTAGENMLLAARLAKKANGEEKARKIAGRLGVLKLWNAMPATLSVGERQRCAIVRALAADPVIILADEPTAALDPLHANKVMDVFLACVEESESALILATHNAEWALAGGLTRIAFRLVEEDGQVTSIIDGAQI